MLLGLHLTGSGGVDSQGLLLLSAESGSRPFLPHTICAGSLDDERLDAELATISPRALVTDPRGGSTNAATCVPPLPVGRGLVWTRGGQLGSTRLTEVAVD